jgi:hypothetical protein
LTDRAIRNGNLSVRAALHLLPDGVIGGSSRGETASSLLTIVFNPGEIVETNVPGDKMTSRCRGAIADFLARSGALAGDQVLLRRRADGTLSVELVR